MKKISPENYNVWIIEDDKALGNLLCEEVGDAGYNSYWTSSAENAIEKLKTDMPDLIVCDLMLPGIDGLAFLKIIQEMNPESPPCFLVITAFGTISRAVESLKAGADEFLTKPLDLEHFMITVKRLLEKKQLKEMVNRMYGFISSESFHDIFGRSEPMRLLFQQIRQVSKARGPVLILGESGSGKELVARAIHKESMRADGPFLPINCAGIPEHLLESEFFGHTAGSFTGAQNRQGIFAEAEGGTLLLDEISEMPLSLQAKLLRILQDGKLRRIGENKEQQVNVRILAATHSDVYEEVKKGNFREDLYYRLETFAIKIPPLRERGGDKELLAARFTQQFSLALKKNVTGLSEKALEIINKYHFPGNVRELRNAIERAVTFAHGEYIQPDHLPARMRKHSAKEASTVLGFPTPNDTHNLIPLEEMERKYITHVLDTVQGNKRKAAEILGIGRRTLYRKIGKSESELFQN
ncbi:Fis family transcriptional regulator [Chitinispirillum alkaliphilum]|nr:Fis family transcriptional regulator [Chitinispirillum alkaliphilum]